MEEFRIQCIQASGSKGLRSYKAMGHMSYLGAADVKLDATDHAPVCYYVRMYVY